MKPITTFLLLAFMSIQAVAQVQPSLRTHLKGYVIVFPGVELAVEFPIKTWSLSEAKTHELIINASPVIDFFNYRGNYNGLGLMAELNPKLNLENGWTYELFGGVGLVNAFLARTAYEIQPDGTFSEKNAKSNQYFSWKAGLGIGKSITISGKNYSVGFRIGAREVRTPGYLVAPEASVGIIIPLKSKNSAQ